MILSWALTSPLKVDGGPDSVSSGDAQQLASVLAGGAVSLPRAEHSHQLAHDLIAAERGDRRNGRRDAAVLGDREMAGGQRRDLRQMGDTTPLPPAGEVPEVLAHRARGVTADSGVDLVEHEQRSGRALFAPSAVGDAQGRENPRTE